VSSRAVRAAIIACSAVACDGGSSPEPASPIRPVGDRLVDAAGRTAILRGVNVRADGLFDMYRGRAPLPPFEPDLDCRIIGDELGLNQVRLAITWSLLEPARGALDDAYIDRVIAVAAACERHGVFTLVDLHQDGWSKYVGDDGAPFWAHQPALPAEDVDERNGGQASTEAAPRRAFDGFFADHDGLVADYARMAAALAARIDGQPGIVGLELMNEPVALGEELDHFHRVVAAAVRAAAPGLPVYVEPDATRNVFDFASPGRLDVTGVVYAPHLYTGVFQGNWLVGDDARIEASVAAMRDEALVNDAPVVVTELGNDPLTPVGAAWIAAAFAALDRHQVSSSFWVYEEWPSSCHAPLCWGFYDASPRPDGAGFDRGLRPAAVTSVARAYPRAIAGELVGFGFDPAARRLEVARRGGAGTHVLAAPTRVFTGDVVVTCDGAPVPHVRTGSRVEVACAGSALVMRPADGAP
jgi:endoglycosylceramidase